MLVPETTGCISCRLTVPALNLQPLANNIAADHDDRRDAALIALN